MTWSADPILFQWGAFTVRWYGLFFASGFILGFHLMRVLFLQGKKGDSVLDRMLFYMIVGTVAGARLGHCLFYEPAVYLANPLRILKVWEGGLASHGAAVGIIISMLLFSRKTNLPFLWLMDRVVIVGALGASLIRIGNFFNSEIEGRVTDVPWAIIFTRVSPHPRHPAQLYESIVYLFCFFVLLYLNSKPKIRKAPGYIFGVFLVLVFTARFLIEFVKENQSAFEQSLPLNMGQILSIPAILAGVFLLRQAQSRVLK